MRSVVDITGKLESQFNSDSWSNSDWSISYEGGHIDLVEILRDLDGETVRLVIEVK